MPDPAGRYVDLQHLQDWWGVRQVDAWADADGDGVRETADDAIIQSAIDAAEGDIDAALAGSHSVPFPAPVPTMVRTIARMRAGVYLASRRGLREGSDPAGRMRAVMELTDRLLDDLRTGRKMLPGVPRRRGSGRPSRNPRRKT